MIEYWLVRALAGLFRLLPFSAIYAFSDATRWVVFNVIGYRKKTVFENLRRAFPEKTEAEIERVAQLFYKNLLDITLEGFKGLTLGREELMRRYVFKNPDAVNAVLAQSRPVILTGMHYGNWEWGVLSFSLWLDGRVFGIYKPLSNPRVEAFLNRKRGQWGMILTHPKATRLAVETGKNAASVYILMADQSPTNAATAQWHSFFGQKTACIHGPETIARAHGIEVWQFIARRQKRGFYEIELEPICREPLEKMEGEITKIYLDRLETIIRQQPQDWLWSHKRWKLTPPSL